MKMKGKGLTNIVISICRLKGYSFSDAILFKSISFTFAFFVIKPDG